MSIKPQDELLQICTSTQQAAKAIQQYSFAILQVPSDTSAAIDKAAHLARIFLTDASKAPQDYQDRYRCIHDGNLYGFNVPSPAKVLFRAISGTGSQHQPWPPNTQWKDLSIQVATKMHAMLYDCYQEILHLEEQPQAIQPSPAKRLKRTTTRRSNNKTNDSNQRPPPPVNPPILLKVPPTLQESTYCPLDYFLYHATKPTTNCSEHIDRGVLIGVCLADVPGLEVLPRNGHGFLCPEAEKQCDGHVMLVCILAGDQLNQLVVTTTNRGSPPGKGAYSACVHRVKPILERSRLSITYELRATSLNPTKGNQEK